MGTYDLCARFEGGKEIRRSELVRVRANEVTEIRCNAYAENCR